LYKEAKMKIDYGKIVTNALSALVATVFVGAAVIVWNAATSIDIRIEEANAGMKEQQSSIKATQETLIPEVADIRMKVYDIENQLKSITQILAETEPTSRKVTFDPDRPFILERFRDNGRPDERREKDLRRISEEIDARQMEFQKER
jgi:hypothetical protein